jgi:hypothetical protein
MLSARVSDKRAPLEGIRGRVLLPNRQLFSCGEFLADTPGGGNACDPRLDDREKRLCRNGDCVCEVLARATRLRSLDRRKPAKTWRSP